MARLQDCGDVPMTDVILRIDIFQLHKWPFISLAALYFKNQVNNVSLITSELHKSTSMMGLNHPSTNTCIENEF